MAGEVRDREQEVAHLALERLGRAPGDLGLDLGGRLSFPELAAVIKGARAIVVGNTGPAHLAAAVGTPVVSLFAPTVPASQWRPHRVPHILLGDQSAPCKDSRARDCPVEGHPCLSKVTPAQVLVAVRALVAIATDRAADLRDEVPA
jgi:ADP-heptose:LPS heptosyltransferase